MRAGLCGTTNRSVCRFAWYGLTPVARRGWSRRITRSCRSWCGRSKSQATHSPMRLAMTFPAQHDAIKQRRVAASFSAASRRWTVVRWWGWSAHHGLHCTVSAYDPKRTSRAGPRIGNVGPVAAALTIDRRGLCPRWIEGVRCAVALSVGLCRWAFRWDERGRIDDIFLSSWHPLELCIFLDC